MTEDIKLALSKGKIKGATKLLEEFYSKEHKQTWLKDMKAEYSNLNYYEDVVVKEAELDEDGGIVSEEVTESKLIEGKPTFDEWLNEVEVLEEAVEADLESGVEAKDKVTKFVREYESPDNFDTEINTYLIPFRLKRLQDIFVDKFEGVKKIAMQKDGDEKYLNAQSEVYDLLYRFSKDGNIPKSRGDMYIQANEASSTQFSRVVETLNGARALVEKMILENTLSNVDGMLDKMANITAEDISIIKSNTTPTTALKKLLGL